MEYKRLKRKDNNNMNNESANLVSSKTPLDNSLTTSQTKNNELSTLSSTQINSFYSYNKIHLFNLITFLKQINTQIEQATKLNNSYDELLSCSIDNKNAVSSSGGSTSTNATLQSAHSVMPSLYSHLHFGHQGIPFSPLSFLMLYYFSERYL